MSTVRNVAQPDTTADELVHFHLLGHAPVADPHASAGLIPAALAPYRDLASLRHDDPIVLSADPPYVHTLVDLVDRALRRHVPPGAAGERLRRLVLRAERGLRRRVTAGERGALAALWDAELQQEPTAADAELLAAELEVISEEFPPSARVVGCDTDVAADVVAHVWRASEVAARAGVRRRIDELLLGLSDILRADEAHSDDGRSPARLSAGVGGSHRDAFDFEAWSDVLRTGPPGEEIQRARRRRIESAIAVLEAQRFFPSDDRPDTGDAFAFAFTSCEAAATAYVTRVPDLVRVVRAMAIAELELQNGYRPSVHDPVFEQFDGRSLTPDDVASFPSYLVCTTDRDLTSTEQAQLVGILASDAPINVLVQVRDVLGEPGGLPLTNGSAPSLIGRRLGTMAMGLGTAFVLQTVSSNLAQVADRIGCGLSAARPALFSVFTGATEHVPGLPPYLIAATANQSRAVPTFTFDPDAGSTWAVRFDVDTNPDQRSVWPVVTVDFEDAEMQHDSESVRVTPIDLAVLDRRYSYHFTPAPPTSWNGGMEPAAGMIASAGEAVDGKVPYLLMADEAGALHRVIVDRQLLREARHYGETWQSLQELAGIDNSHALALLAVEREKWEEERGRERAEAGDGSRHPAADVVETRELEEADAAPDEVGAEEAAGAPAEGEAYIETARCTTCDECTKLNPRMFAYDENKQAYLVDPTAGTFRELVEAAEACQVAIIHPGTPWDPSEPNLDELVDRAAAFA
jgi:hypothetical protein